jgi:hypothetical protein
VPIAYFFLWQLLFPANGGYHWCHPPRLPVVTDVTGSSTVTGVDSLPSISLLGLCGPTALGIYRLHRRSNVFWSPVSTVRVSVRDVSASVYRLRDYSTVSIITDYDYSYWLLCSAVLSVVMSGKKTNATYFHWKKR